MPKNKKDAVKGTKYHKSISKLDTEHEFWTTKNNLMYYDDYISPFHFFK